MPVADIVDVKVGATIGIDHIKGSHAREAKGEGCRFTCTDGGGAAEATRRQRLAVHIHLAAHRAHAGRAVAVLYLHEAVGHRIIYHARNREGIHGTGDEVEAAGICPVAVVDRPGACARHGEGQACGGGSCLCAEGDIIGDDRRRGRCIDEHCGDTEQAGAWCRDTTTQGISDRYHLISSTACGSYLYGRVAGIARDRADAIVEDHFIRSRPAAHAYPQVGAVACTGDASTCEDGLRHRTHCDHRIVGNRCTWLAHLTTTGIGHGQDGIADRA